MKIAKLFMPFLFMAPCSSFGGNGNFNMAAQLLNAAKNANIQQVQRLISNGADVNFVDGSGMSLVCTAIMNQDIRASQILQMYGADASQCDRQIKRYKNTGSVKNVNGGFFGGLSNPQMLALGGAAVAGSVVGLSLLTDVFDAENNNHDSAGNSGTHGGGSSGGGGNADVGTLGLTTYYGPAMTTAAAENANYIDNLNVYSNSESGYWDSYNLMTNAYGQNYLLMMHGYSAFARGYLGMNTLRAGNGTPLSLGYSLGTSSVMGGMPVGVALITANGINVTDESSLKNRFLVWTTKNGDASVNAASNTMISSKYYNNQIVWGTDNSTVDDDTVVEDGVIANLFDLSGLGTAIRNVDATEYDNLLAKVVGGGVDLNDFAGFLPNGQLAIFRTGESSFGTTDYYNYTALSNALNLAGNVSLGRSKPSVIANVDVIEPLHLASALRVSDVSGQADFISAVNQYYDLVDDSVSPGVDANTFFTRLGDTNSALVIFSTGASKVDREGTAPLVATFENAAPAIFSGLEHLFMSVVAVGLRGGTSETDDVSDYSPSGKYELSYWTDAETGNSYLARVAGAEYKNGATGVDPWFFAAAGVTDELAVSAAAGAAGVVKSAFDLSDKQTFLLLALTADGPYLGANDNGVRYTEQTLISYLQSMYTLPNNYQMRVDNGENYLDVFKEVFGYGLINLERATTPGKSLYFYDGNNIISTSGNAYWRAAVNSGVRNSAVLNLRGASISMNAYDVLENLDGSLSLPRVWKNTVMFGENDGRHALYMGDVLADFKTNTHKRQNSVWGNFSFSMAQSERNYTDNMSGVDILDFNYLYDNLSVGVGYQHYFTDGESRFTGVMNPVLSLVSNVVTSDFLYSVDNFSMGGRIFSGNITDDGLLEKDPVVSSQFEPAKLGGVNGAEVFFHWKNNQISFKSSFGVFDESGTLLGAKTSGLLDLGNGRTNYVYSEFDMSPFDCMKLKMQATFAYTHANDAYVDITDMWSNSFGVGLDIGNFEFGLSQPLAIVRGNIKNIVADYDVVPDGDNGYGIVVKNFETNKYDLSAQKRELRLSGTYRHHFGDFTDGAVGFIYRLNPNNIDDFGNETVFMLKMSHRVGI